MTLSRHLDEAVTRMKDAADRIEQARDQPVTIETLRDWVAAVSDFCLALSDVHTFTNESVHEKLHELAERARVKTVAPGGRAQRPK